MHPALWDIGISKDDDLKAAFCNVLCCKAMRPASRPWNIFKFDSVLGNTPSSKHSRLLQSSGPLATRCFHTQFRGVLPRLGRDIVQHRKHPSPASYDTRRWQSKPSKPEDTNPSPTPSNEDAVEERLRRIKEEYASRELEARRKKEEEERKRKELEERQKREREEREKREREEQQKREAEERQRKELEERQDALKAEAARKAQQRPPSKSETVAPAPKVAPSAANVPLPMTPIEHTPPPPQTPPPSPISTSPRSLRSPPESSPLVNNEKLPSYARFNRSELTARFQTFMERLMASAAIASHRLNSYTGTDYSGISALRQGILSQENAVKSALQAVTTAKDAYSAAFAAQATSQKEVVQLLERKHSWTAADLERYMSLIRSEHLNEQTVQKSKEELGDRERALEDTRARLERLERRQYHEEQIWSDTIRRNSTWVTFGLMGFNVVLLLASLLLFEPWRRRRLVKEIRTVLDEKTGVSKALAGAGMAGGSMTVEEALQEAAQAQVEVDVDAAVPPSGETLEYIEAETAAAGVPVQVLSVDASGPEFVSADPTTTPTSTTDPTTSTSSPDTLSTSSADPGTPPWNHHSSSSSVFESPTFTLPTFWHGTWSGTWSMYKAYWSELFSERQVAVRKVDLTATALEGAAAGAAFMGLLFVLLRPR